MGAGTGVLFHFLFPFQPLRQPVAIVFQRPGKLRFISGAEDPRRLFHAAAAFPQVAAVQQTRCI